MSLIESSESLGEVHRPINDHDFSAELGAALPQVLEVFQRFGSEAKFRTLSLFLLRWAPGEREHEGAILYPQLQKEKKNLRFSVELRMP